MATDGKKLSFAKVAAAGTKEAPSAAATARSAVPAKAAGARGSQPAPSAPPVANGSLAKVPTPVVRAIPSDEKPVTDAPAAEGKVMEGLKDLKLEIKTPSLVVYGTSSTVTEGSSKTGNSQTPSDEASQREDSVSESDTKPASLDGKSITSGTTFALDEKESLRPDDSASVKAAAAEDDDAFSIRGSLIAGSRMGSEVAARVHRIQLGDMPPRTITTHVIPTNQTQGVATPQSSTSEKPEATEPQLPLDAATTAPDSLSGNGFYRQNPDDKLLEAMQSPKDRFFLLRLEAQVIDFVQDSKMLTHKLADYYHMTHSFEAVAGAVRIYRTPFCRVPPPLSSIVVNPSSNNSPSQAVLPRKIMRRDRDGDPGTLSGDPSKPTSEAGSDSKDKSAPTKEKLTREEREEAYNRARERIFGSTDKTETSTPDNDESNGVSRASSVSAKDKASQAKRKTAKQRRDDSESFDSRSQYVAWCGPQQPPWGAPQYVPISNSQFNGQIQPPRPDTLQPVYAAAQPYPPVMPGSGYSQPYTTVPHTGYPQPPPTGPQQQRYPAQTTPMSTYAPPIQTVPQQGWQQQQQSFSNSSGSNGNQSPYQARATPVSSSGIPYAYGQLPVHVNPNDPKSQHPIPGSYNRHAFNPKTQSFVPANGMVPVQPAPLAYGTSSPHHGSPQFHVPHINYNGYQQPIPQVSPPYGASGPGYNMTRQGSNNSVPSYHPGQPLAPGPPPGPQQILPLAQPAHIPSKPAIPQGSTATFGTLPTYGNPATLPQKPTASKNLTI